MHADRLPLGNGAADRFAGRFHVTELERIVLGHLGGQERPGLIHVRVTAPDEHRGKRLADAEISHESPHLVA